jgi:hypothetical protein
MGKTSSVSTIWTQANAKYKPGEPLLSEEDLKAAGPSYQQLHNHYILESANGVENIGVKFHAINFETALVENFYIGFKDLYDLFNLDALDVSLLRCFSL